MNDIKASIFRGRDRSDGSERWHLDFGLPGGRRKRRNFATKVDAERELARLRLRYFEGGTETNVCLAELLDMYLDDRKSRGLKDSTSADYRQRRKYYIDDHLGRRPARLLTRGQVQFWIDNLTDQGLSSNTIRNTFKLVSGALRWAEARNLVDFNPTQGVELPKMMTKHRERIWTSSEASQALDAPGPERLKVVLQLALRLALRKGEILGLQWREVNFDHREIAISSTAYAIYDPSPQAGNSRLSISSPKSEASNRVLPLDEELLEILLSWRQVQLSAAAAAKSEPPIWVIPSKNGNPVSPSNLARQFKRFCNNNDLETVTFHSLRKTSLVMALQGGASIEETSQFAGHTSINLTKHVYARFVPGFNHGAARAISNVIGVAP